MSNPFRRLRNCPDPIATLDAAVDAVVNGVFREEWPNIVYHYTGWDKAKSVLLSNEFWATAHDCTDDKAELLTADQLVDEAAQRLKEDGGACGALLGLLLEREAKLHVANLAPPFLACFSAAHDKPSQWREYADGGTGVCLGVATLPGERVHNEGFGTGFARVRYDVVEVEREVRDAFSAICKHLQSAIDAGVKDTKRLAIIGLTGFHRVAAHAAILTKKKTFSQEEEWRLFAIAQPGRGRVYDRGTTERPWRYVRLKLRPGGKRMRLRELLIGPNQDCESARQRAADLLHKAGYSSDSDETPAIVCSSAEI